MRKVLKGYYDFDQKIFSELWNNCIFVFDTNVLLDLYRYSKESSQNVIQILNSIKSNRLWLPYQVAHEYHDNRIAVIKEQIRIYERFEESESVLKESFKKKFIEELNKFRQNPKMEKRHPFITNTSNILNELEYELEAVNESIESIYKYNDFIQLKRYRNYYTKLLVSDSILEKVSDIFDNCIGEKYSYDVLQKIEKIGDFRYQNSIPPGYMDSKEKENLKKFGDLIIWNQILEKAKKEKRSIIFITNETKEDWWLKDGKKILGPRPELINEFSDETNLLFYMYSIDEFIKYAQNYKIMKIDKNDELQVQSTIKEIEFLKSLNNERNIELVVTLIGRIFGERNPRLKTKYSEKEIYDLMQESIETLPDVEKEIILSKYITNINFISDEEICEKLDLDIDDFEFLESKAFRRLRHPKRSRRLKDLFADE